MFKKKRGKQFFDTNLDPLMDVLTCAVGVMLFVVIFAVMEARGVSIKMFTPMLKEPPPKSERKIFLCKDGMIRFFDWGDSAKELLKGIKNVGFYGVPSFVETANKKNITDGFFRYELEYDEWGFWPSQSRSISVVINPIEGSPGESVEDFKKPTSKLLERLKHLDKDKVWISFLLDGKSLKVFREARGKALEAGFSVGWDPTEIIFPYKECIAGCGGGSSGRGRAGLPGIADTVQ